MSRHFTDPYFWPFHTMIVIISNELLDRGVEERCEIIFDEDAIFGKRASIYYEAFKSLMDPAAQAILPINLMFQEDTEFVPLQVADMFAWCFQRNASGRPHRFAWLLPALSNIKPSQHSEFYSKDRLQFILDKSSKTEVTDEMLRKYRELLGEELPRSQKAAAARRRRSRRSVGAS